MIRRSRFRTIAAVAGAFALTAVLTACGSSSSGTTSDGKTVIRYQDAAGNLSLFQLADALGYLPDIQLKDIGIVQGGPQALQAVGTGQADIAGAFTGATENVIANGTPLTAVVSFLGSNSSVYGGVLTKSGSTLTKPQDFIGKKIAVNTLGAQWEATLDTWFTAAGMTPDQIKQVELVPLPAINSEAAVRNGQVDAALISGALFTQALKTPGLKVVVKDTDILGDYDGDQYVMANSWLKGHPAAAKEFVGGMAKALVYTQTHSVADTLNIIKPYLEAHDLKDDATALSSYLGTGVSAKGGVISARDFSRWIPWLQQKGLIKGTPDVSKMFTNEYNPYANGGGDAKPEPSASAGAS